MVYIYFIKLYKHRHIGSLIFILVFTIQLIHQAYSYYLHHSFFLSVPQNCLLWSETGLIIKILYLNNFLKIITIFNLQNTYLVYFIWALPKEVYTAVPKVFKIYVSTFCFLLKKNTRILSIRELGKNIGTTDK